MSGSGIRWATCKSAPRSRQITMPAPHHLVFTGRMPFLLPNLHWRSTIYIYSAEIKNQIKGALRPEARTGHWQPEKKPPVSSTRRTADKKNSTQSVNHAPCLGCISAARRERWRRVRTSWSDDDRRRCECRGGSSHVRSSPTCRHRCRYACSPRSTQTVSTRTFAKIITHSAPC